MLNATAAPCWACGAETEPTEQFGGGLRRCRGCGLLFAPERDSASVHDLYRGDEYFEQYPGGMVEEDAARVRAIEARTRVRMVRRFVTAGRLLELGAAAGYFLAEARAAGFDVVGIEPTDNAAVAAREHFGLEVLHGFAEEVELPAATFDAVCAWHVLEHISEPLPTIERVREWLAPGGHLFLEVPNIASVQARRRGAGWSMLFPEHHVAHYSPTSLRALLERAGMDVRLTRTVAYTTYRPATSPIAWASGARHLAISGRWPWRPHPWRHELLQAVAQRR
jgi:SAM-dependent methyltransferase